VNPESDGSFTVTELYNGTFVTLGTTQPDAPCNALAAGITGTFAGDYAVHVPTGSDLNFNATCAAGCTTRQFFTAFFGKPDAFIDTATYAWQFHYDAGPNGTWDNTDHGNTGNIHN
jgi:hypothetical protein